MNSIFYLETKFEKQIFKGARDKKLPVLLKGPTGSGKTRFVEHMAQDLKMEVVKVACNEDTSASDLLGRFLLKGNETIWQDGPVTKAVRKGCLLYLDEIAEAREDVLVVLHSLSDYRRELSLDKTNEVLIAPDTFMLIASFNPGYQNRIREMKPSTRQRFVTIDFHYPDLDAEKSILKAETKCADSTAKALTLIAKKIRSLNELNLRETVSTRLLVQTALLIESGIAPRTACNYGMVQSLTDDYDTALALNDLCALYF